LLDVGYLVKLIVKALENNIKLKDADAMICSDVEVINTGKKQSIGNGSWRSSFMLILAGNVDWDLNITRQLDFCIGNVNIEP